MKKAIIKIVDEEFKKLLIITHPDDRPKLYKNLDKFEDSIDDFISDIRTDIRCKLLE